MNQDSSNQFPLISCVMPTYGRPDFVPEAVGMFLAQDYPRKELVIFNDCPGQILTNTLPVHAGVRVCNINERYSTLGQKRNAAIGLARGDWIAVWDDDDAYLPWHLSQAMAQIQERGTRFYRPESFWAYWGDQGLVENQVVPGWVNHAVVVFHKSLWQRAGGYPAMDVGEDAEFFDRIHDVLGETFLKYPIASQDRSFVLRGKSAYRHSCMSGGENPLDRTQGVFYIEPVPIRDVSLRQAYENLIRVRGRDAASPAVLSPWNPKASASDQPAPMLSICIAVKNRSRERGRNAAREIFPRCVRALAQAASLIGPLELVVADYHSTDWPLADWLDDLAGPLQVQLIDMPGDFSRGAGLNAAVQAARSDHLFLCDADILVDPEVLTRSIDLLNANKAWFPVCQYLDEHEHDAYWQDFGMGLAFVTREVFEKAGGVPEFKSWGGEDDLFYGRVKTLAEIVRAREPGLRHLWHDEESRHRHYTRLRKADFYEQSGTGTSPGSSGGFASESVRTLARQAAVDFYQAFAGDYAARDKNDEATTPEVFPAYGTLLGMIRDGDVIAHDSDVDFGCLDWPDTVPSEIGGQVGPFTLSHRFHYQGKPCELVFHHENGIKVDLFRFVPHGPWRRAAAFPDEFPHHTTMLECFHESMFTRWQEVEYWGKRFRVPSPPERLLTAMYGEDWRHTNPGWSFWGRNCAVTADQLSVFVDDVEAQAETAGHSIDRLFSVLRSASAHTRSTSNNGCVDDRPLVRIALDSFWPNFDLDRFRAYFRFLDDSYRFELSEHPDVVFHSVFSSGVDTRSRWPQAVRVFFTGENREPPLGEFDYCISFYRGIDQHPDARHLRLPLFVSHLYTLGMSLGDLKRPNNHAARPIDKRRKFCTFVATNPNSETRNGFVQSLSRYKAVDCPGRVLNNMHTPKIGDAADSQAKIEFLRDYRYAVCFENTATRFDEGYVTEKIVDAMLAGCIPLYWGDRRVAEDFNPDSFIDLTRFGDDVEAMAQHVAKIDQDPAAMQKLSQSPWLPGNQIPKALDEDVIRSFFAKIFADAMRRRLGVVPKRTEASETKRVLAPLWLPAKVLAHRNEICSDCSQAEGHEPDQHTVYCAAAKRRISLGYDRCRLRKWSENHIATGH